MTGSSLSAYLAQSADVIRAAAGSALEAAMAEAIELCVVALQAGKPILVCGNGGSASDAMHIAGELVARFKKERKGQNVICLSCNPAMITAWANDYEYASVFARQVEAYGSEGAVLLAISTSGNSANVVQACEKARSLDMRVIGLTGQGGAKMAALCDVLLDAPTKDTPMVQQVHLCLYHYLCEKIEERVMG